LKVVEVPIIFTDRFQGRSKMTGHIIREAFMMVWRLWLQNGMRRRPHQPPAGPELPPGRVHEEKDKDDPQPPGSAKSQVSFSPPQRADGLSS
ncbi:MAG TPA: hypothetical protein VHI52_11355, partial [Verrucomicrobiae bacterium]|nr:hypothetical protein [Verrucomicrobiae bacterium]